MFIHPSTILTFHNNTLPNPTQPNQYAVHQHYTKRQYPTLPLPSISQTKPNQIPYQPTELPWLPSSGGISPKHLGIGSN